MGGGYEQDEKTMVLGQSKGKLHDGIPEALPVALRSGSCGEAPQPLGQFSINACGHTLEMDMKCCRTLEDLQDSLQFTLQMENQTFDFFDVHGTALPTDSQLREAVAKGQTPLRATLTDASINFIENRREELAQMQWKLVRDQLMIASAKITLMDTQLKDTQSQLNQFKQESTRRIEEVQDEAVRSLQVERDVNQTEFRQISERLSAAAQLTSSERHKRDVAVKGLEKQLETVRGMVENERHAREQDEAVHASALKDVTDLMEAEKKEQEAFKDKHLFDIGSVLDKVDAFQKHVREMFQDHQTEAANTAAGLHSHLQGYLREATRQASALDSTAKETKVGFAQMEERCVSLENRIAELSSRQASTVDRIVECHERVSKEVESLKFDERHNKDQVQDALTRIKDLHQSMEATEEATRDLFLQEREGRDEQMRTAQLVWRSEQKKQMSELEAKWIERLERQSMSPQRERNDRVTYDQMGVTPRRPRLSLRSPGAVRQMSTVEAPQRQTPPTQVPTCIEGVNGNATALAFLPVSPRSPVAGQPVPQVPPVWKQDGSQWLRIGPQRNSLKPNNDWTEV